MGNVLVAIPLGPETTELDNVLYHRGEAEGTWSRGVRCPALWLFCCFISQAQLDDKPI